MRQQISIFLFAIIAIALTSPQASFLAIAKRSHSDGGSGSTHDSGSNPNDSGGSSNGNGDSGNTGDNGNDKGTSDQDKKINDPLNPGKDDNKDISDIPSENCGKNAACAVPEKPIESVTTPPPPSCKPDQKCGELVGACVVGIKSPCNGPGFDGQPLPLPKPKPLTIITTINIIINLIHKASHHTTVQKVGIDGNCYQAIKLFWSANMHKGQNAQVDNYITNCLGVTK